MAFMNNPASGGEFTPFVKYNAKAGRWYTKKDEPDAAEFEVANMTAIFDMDNLQTGWFLFAAGTAPVKQMDPSLTEAAPSPGDGFKRGFQMNVYSEKNLLGTREFSSTAGSVIEAMNDLHDDWLAGSASNPGKLPVVKCTSVSPIVNKHGTNFKPILNIVGWEDRPADLKAPGKPAPTTTASAPTAQAAEHAPPPAAQQTAEADAVEF